MNAGARPRGLLVAIDGTRGRDVADDARRLWDALKGSGVKGGISWWDASGTFFEARQVKKKEFVPSPRTLILFYAVDLQFRLRWEIEPLLAEGCTVVAAPYTETVRTFGRAAGLPKDWVDAVLAPLPRADVTFCARERKKKSGWKGTTAEGFCETCALAMINDGQQFDPVRLRAAMIDAFDRRQRRGALIPLRKKTIRRLVKQVRAQRPRSGGTK
jgi:hypothetical protein